MNNSPYHFYADDFSKNSIATAAIKERHFKGDVYENCLFHKRDNSAREETCNVEDCKAVFSEKSRFSKTS